MASSCLAGIAAALREALRAEAAAKEEAEAWREKAEEWQQKCEQQAQLVKLLRSHSSLSAGSVSETQDDSRLPSKSVSFGSEDTESREHGGVDAVSSQVQLAACSCAPAP